MVLHLQTSVLWHRQCEAVLFISNHQRALKYSFKNVHRESHGLNLHVLRSSLEHRA